MMGHKICFSGEIWLIIPKLSLLSSLTWSTITVIKTKEKVFDFRLAIQFDITWNIS